MKIEKFWIRCSTWDGEESFAVDGYRINDFLAVTKHHRKNLWAVTHINTGFSLGYQTSYKARAIRLANKVKDLDWNFKTSKSKKLNSLKILIEKSIRDIEPKYFRFL